MLTFLPLTKKEIVSLAISPFDLWRAITHDVGVVSQSRLVSATIPRFDNESLKTKVMFS